MRFSQDELTALCQRAAALSDSGGAGLSLEMVEARLNRWREVAAKGDAVVFVRRLAWDGMDAESLRARWLTKDALQSLPAWAEIIQTGLEAASPETPGAAPRFINPSRPLPFEELYTAFVLDARKRLVAQADAFETLLTPDAQAALERQLLAILCGLGLHAFNQKFVAERMAKKPLLFLGLIPPTGEPPRELYQAFVATHLNGGLLAFFQEYPVLARLIGTAVEKWVEATAEFIHRLSADCEAIRETFSPNNTIGQVISLSPGLSDSHNGGRQVIIVTFASGLKLVYKPKNLGLEEAYNALTAWINERLPTPDFKANGVLNRGGEYGWVEFIEHLPCTDAAIYYRRIGMLLCLIYALEGTDCHYENIIACGDTPALVDMEALLHYRVEVLRQEVDDAQEAINRQFEYSVLRTGFLPQWIFKADGQSYDISALGHIGADQTDIRVTRWQKINTDLMKPGPERVKPVVGDSAPLVNGEAVPPGGYVAQIMDGFRQMYAFLIAHREALLAGPIPAFAAQDVRFVFRDTRIYSVLADNLLRPEFLTDGLARSIELDILSRALIASESWPEFWPVATMERQAMEGIDVPFFAARSDSPSLALASGAVIENCFPRPSYEAVVERLTRLNEADMRQQLQFIQGAFDAHIAHQSLSGGRTHQLSAEEIAPLTDADMLEEALRLADELRQRAFIALDGSASWISMRFVAQAERYQFMPIGHNLYDGSSGIALFLAALASITGRGEYRELALAAIQPLRKTLAQPKLYTRYFDQEIGGASGWGSLTYALGKISQFLNEPELLDDACLAAAQITPERAETDTFLDVTLGAAGAILGLVALHDAGDKEALARADACGRALLAKRVPAPSGHLTWPTLDSRLLTGFSHGAAGIAYALLRLHAATGESSYLDAAREAAAYERSVFSPEAGNWPDFRVSTPEAPAFMTSWCHGAPGIGLARLGGLSSLEDEAIHADIETALATTRHFAVHGVDHLCCGSLGRGEFMLAAGSRLGLPDMLEAARQNAAAVVREAQSCATQQSSDSDHSHDRYLLFPGLPRGVYNPGFFQGASGIGYHLLRLAYPDHLPSVLLWG